MAEPTTNSRGGNLYSPWYREPVRTTPAPAFTCPPRAAAPQGSRALCY